MDKIITLHKDDTMSWALMPYAIKRIKDFCVKYHTDTDPAELAKLIQAHFVTDTPFFLVQVMVRKGKGVIGHSLCCIDELTGIRFLTIMQYELDEKPEDYEPINEAWRAAAAWGRSMGANDAQLITLDEKREALFEKHFGFARHRIVMRASLREV